MAERFKHKPADLDFKLEQVTTSAGRKYVLPNGKKYPSVTTVMHHLSADSIAEWRANVGEEEANRVSRHAATRGTAVHDLMERYIKNEKIDEKKLMPLYSVSFKKLKPIIDECLSEVYAQEAKMYSDFLGLAGQVDLIGKWDGVTSIIDFKTSRKVKKKEWISGYFMQMTAYSIMFEERTGRPAPNIVVVMDVDEHEPLVFKEHRDNWVEELQATIAEYHRLERCKPL